LDEGLSLDFGDIFCHLLFFFVKKDGVWFVFNKLLSHCFFELNLDKLRIGIEHAKYKVAEKSL